MFPRITEGDGRVNGQLGQSVKGANNEVAPGTWGDTEERARNRHCTEDMRAESEVQGSRGRGRRESS